MSGAQAAGVPWPPFAACGPRWDELFAAMTGRRVHSGPHAFGPWGVFAGPAPFGPWPGAGRGRGPKARPGDVRAAILAVLAEHRMNGYQIIQEIAERSGGAWKPSPGSIYPTLAQLEDEGLVRAEEDEGRRVFTLTDEGRVYVSDHPDEVSAPWQATVQPETDDGLKPLIGQVAAAIWQIATVGTPAQQAKGKEALTELRRRLHAILAEDDETTDGQS